MCVGTLFGSLLGGSRGAICPGDVMACLGKSSSSSAVISRIGNSIGSCAGGGFDGWWGRECRWIDDVGRGGG